MNQSEVARKDQQKYETLYQERGRLESRLLKELEIKKVDLEKG